MPRKALFILSRLLLCGLFSIWQLYFAPRGAIQFPVLLAAQTLLLLPVFPAVKHRWIKAIAIIVLAGSTLYILYGQNRAAIFGLATGTPLYYYLNGQLNRTITKLILAIALPLLLLALAFGCKTSSSQGRLLIYRVIFENTTAADYIQGVGVGKFKVLYNLWQANYFKNHGINSPEALLADNTYYAFNDYLQFVLERGIAGLLLIIALLISIILIVRSLKQSGNANTAAKAALASATVIFAAALFSYPLQYGIIRAWVFICLLTAVYGLLPRRKRFTKLPAYMLGVTIFATILLAGYKVIQEWQLQKIKQKLIAYNQAGYNQKALAGWENLVKRGYGHNDPDVYCQYARALYYARETTQSPAVQQSYLYFLQHRLQRMFTETDKWITTQLEPLINKLAIKHPAVEVTYVLIRSAQV